MHHTIPQNRSRPLSNNPEVIYYLSIINEMIGNNKEARKWYDILITQCPNDPNIHQRIGALYAADQDESQVVYHNVSGIPPLQRKLQAPTIYHTQIPQSIIKMFLVRNCPIILRDWRAPETERSQMETHGGFVLQKNGRLRASLEALQIDQRRVP